MEKQLSESEIQERVAILKRFRKLLEEQRAKFKEYLKVLESQETKINADDTESLAAHTELEKQIVKNISSLQKVIEPMQSIYNQKGEKSEEVNKIQNDLADLQKKVLAQNEKNQDLLRIQMDQVKTQLTAVAKNNPFRGRTPIFADGSGRTGQIIQLDA